MDPHLLQLFCSDLMKFTGDLKSRLLTFNITIDKELITPLITDLESIKSASQIMNFTTIFELCKSLSAFFEQYRRGQLTIIPDQITLFVQICDEFLKIAEAPNPQQEITKKEQKLAGFLTIVNSFQTQKEELERQDKREDHEGSKVNRDATMMNLLHVELKTQVANLNQSLVKLEQNPQNKDELYSLMRFSHSIKGAARVVNLDTIVKLAHVMEDFFSAAQKNLQIITEESIDTLFLGVDILQRLASIDETEIDSWIDLERDKINSLVKRIESLSKKIKTENIQEKQFLYLLKKEKSEVIKPPAIQPERVLRVSAQHLNNLMGLAGESLVESRWLQPFLDSILILKKYQDDVFSNVNEIVETMMSSEISPKTSILIKELKKKMNILGEKVSNRLVELELFNLRFSNLSDKIYREVIETRMRPFHDVVEVFPRMVRDLARSLNKKVKLEIIGEETPVDRDILEKLEIPLGHLLRNAVDHGIELPEERAAAGKPQIGSIRVEAKHLGGVLAITVSDDGAGPNIEKVREKIIENKLITSDLAARLSDNDILDFLFLPGFSTSKTVSEISGRGMGLNIVQNMVNEVGGSVKVTFQQGKGTTIQFLLPITLSILRSLIVQIAGEPYAFSLSHINKALTINRKDIQLIENKEYFKLGDRNVGIIAAHHILELPAKTQYSEEIPIVVLSSLANIFGISVDSFVGEKELVVHELDKRLGKVQDVSSGAFLEDGSPVLILNPEELMTSIDNFIKGNKPIHISSSKESIAKKLVKKILIADDSVTVLELEYRLLQNRGYEVSTAGNGEEALRKLREGQYDLLITDIDMPLMNGIELIRTIKKDLKLKALPVIIVSYKDKEGDRESGLAAGADVYLTKSSFEEDILQNTAANLIKINEESKL